MTVSSFDDEVEGAYNDIDIAQAANEVATATEDTTADSAQADADATEAERDLANALAQVEAALEKMANNKVLGWLEELTLHKWARLGKDPAITMSKENLTITSS